MTKRKPQKRKKSPKKIYKISTINKFLALLLLSLLVTLAAYFILLKNHNDKKEELENIEKQEIEKIDNNNIDKILEEYKKNTKEPIVDKYEEYNNDLEKEYIHQKDFEKIEKVLKEQKEEVDTLEKKVFPENKETNIEDKVEEKIPLPALEDKVQKEEKKKEEKVLVQTSPKPKLAIVIDDVTLQSQINHINDIGYTVNIALMPPTKGHKDSAIIAQNLPFAIVHFPLQAVVKKFEEQNTIKN